MRSETQVVDLALSKNSLQKNYTSSYLHKMFLGLIVGLLLVTNHQCTQSRVTEDMNYMNTSAAPLNNTPSNENMTDFYFGFGHDLTKPFSLFIGFSFLLIIIVAVFCNLVLILAILFVRRLQSFLHVFIVNMAVSDLITALGTIPLDVEYMLRGYFPHGEITCGIMQTVFLISLPSSVLCLTLLTAERFLAVVFPLKIRKIITKTRVVIAIIVAWSYVLLVAFFPLMYDKNAVIVISGNCFFRMPLEYSIFQLSVNFLLPIVFICGVNIFLCVIAHRHAKEQASITSRLTSSSSPVSQKDSVPVKRVPRKLYKKESITSLTAITKNLKAAKRIALLVGVFLVCWLSYIIIVASNFICRCNQRELTWIGNVINYSSTAINPVLYGLLNKTIRREVIAKVRRTLRHYFPCMYKYRFMRGPSFFEVRFRKRAVVNANSYTAPEL